VLISAGFLRSAIEGVEKQAVNRADIGALLLESLNNGMGLMNIESSFQQIVDGLVLLAARFEHPLAAVGSRSVWRR
jgi:ABC-type xylose transport system permease subunit